MLPGRRTSAATRSALRPVPPRVGSRHRPCPGAVVPSRPSLPPTTPGRTRDRPGVVGGSDGRDGTIPSTPRPAPAPVEPRERVPSTRSGRRWQLAVGGAAVLMLLAVCGVGTTALINDGSLDSFGRFGTESAPTLDPPTPAPVPSPSIRSLSSRQDDPTPLTASEVFPSKELVVVDGKLAYQVLKTHSGASCAVAASGDVADLLERLGCSQVVRATLRAPDGEHLATAGLFNLLDSAGAERARERIKPMLDERQGRFRGMAAGEGTEAVARSSARVGWQVRGHYLAYTVVARVDGETIPAANEQVQEILYDLIELYLNRTVLERRATGTALVPSTAPTAGLTTSPGGGGPSEGGRPDDGSPVSPGTRPSENPDGGPSDNPDTD